jgi:hypothetical protein
MSGVAIAEMRDQDLMPTATVFFMIWVRCSDNNICAFESTESASNPQPNSTLIYAQPYNGVYLQSEVYNPRTPGMIAAAAILSAFGPIFFIVYYIADNMHYTRTGKPLAW